MFFKFYIKLFILY